MKILLTTSYRSIAQKYCATYWRNRHRASCDPSHASPFAMARDARDFFLFAISRRISRRKRRRVPRDITPPLNGRSMPHVADSRSKCAVAERAASRAGDDHRSRLLCGGPPGPRPLEDAARAVMSLSLRFGRVGPYICTYYCARASGRRVTVYIHAFASPRHSSPRAIAI